MKVYAAGATITRIANLQLNAEEVPEHIEIAGLPLALNDSTVRVCVEAEPGTSTAIATDVRIGLAVPPPQDIQSSPTDEEVREAKAEVQRLEDAIALIEYEISALYQLDVPQRPETEIGQAPPPSPLGARLTLTNFKDEQVRLRIQEKRETQEKLRQAEENLDDLLAKQAHASSAREAKPDELRKTVIVRLSYEGEPSTFVGQQLLIEYFVPGARWTPSYVCRLNSAENQAEIAVRAFICQRTGEDWSGVRLELSTAEPMMWSELPELPSLRLGRAQSGVRQSGWRLPPVGAEILFEDFDRHKRQVRLDKIQYSAIAHSDVPEVTPLPPIPNQMGFSDFGVGNVHFESMSGAARMAPAVFAECEESLNVETAAPEPTSPSLQNRLEDYKAKKRAAAAPPQAPEHQRQTSALDKDSSFDFLAYNLMRMGKADNRTQRGKLSIESQQEVYLEILKHRNVTVTFDVMEIVQWAASNAQSCIYIKLPQGGIQVRKVAGSFDYAYSADGRVDVSSDGQFHSVALTRNSTDINLRYVVVPREDTNVFRIAQLKNPLSAPLLAGPVDVYVDGEYLLSTKITTVPPKGHMELGLGVEQAIKVARNTAYQEARSGETLVAFNELRHQIQIDIANRLPREAHIEVRERLPIPNENAKVDVQIDSVSPEWEKYEQEERGTPIRGGYRWQVQVPGGEQTTLSLHYTIKTFVDNELMNGNRRE